jgi:hypothetical protein
LRIQTPRPGRSLRRRRLPELGLPQLQQLHRRSRHRRLLAQRLGRSRHPGEHQEQQQHQLRPLGLPLHHSVFIDLDDGTYAGQIWDAFDAQGIACGSRPGGGGGAVCGNNIKETGETCDGTDLDGQTCVSQGYASGTLACNSGCGSFNTSRGLFLWGSFFWLLRCRHETTTRSTPVRSRDANPQRSVAGW